MELIKSKIIELSSLDQTKIDDATRNMLQSYQQMSNKFRTELKNTEKNFKKLSQLIAKRQTKTQKCREPNPLITARTILAISFRSLSSSSSSISSSSSAMALSLDITTSKITDNRIRIRTWNCNYNNWYGFSLAECVYKCATNTFSHFGALTKHRRWRYNNPHRPNYWKPNDAFRVTPIYLNGRQIFIDLLNAVKWSSGN